ncbi:hypothetical protein LINPERHAP2_LOCUS6701 [Linum perenne]
MNGGGYPNGEHFSILHVTVVGNSTNWLINYRSVIPNKVR